MGNPLNPEGPFGPVQQGGTPVIREVTEHVDAKPIQENIAFLMSQGIEEVLRVLDRRLVAYSNCAQLGSNDETMAVKGLLVREAVAALRRLSDPNLEP